MDKQKPSLTHLSPRATLEEVLAFFRKLTGREPTEADKEAAKAVLLKRKVQAAPQ